MGIPDGFTRPDLTAPLDLSAAKSAGVLDVPLPDEGFDPTESAVPWRALTDAGIDVVFATEATTRPARDLVVAFVQAAQRLVARLQASAGSS